MGEGEDDKGTHALNQLFFLFFYHSIIEFAQNFPRKDPSVLLTLQGNQSIWSFYYLLLFIVIMQNSKLTICNTTLEGFCHWSALQLPEALFLTHSNNSCNVITFPQLLFFWIQFSIWSNFVSYLAWYKNTKISETKIW